MLEKNLESMTAYANERPPDSTCLNCKRLLKPYFRPALFGLSARWFPAEKVCSSCEELHEAQARIFTEQRRIDEAFRNSRMSVRFQQRTFENFIPKPGTQKAYEAALDFQPDEHWLLFLGACGVGKTHLAAAIANRQMGKVPTLFLCCSQFLWELREGISGSRKHHQLFDLACQVKLLVLDDIGAERGSEWVQETLFLLLNYRYEALLPTIFTTNCSLEQLEEKLGERASSRIIEMSRCIRMSGANWRIKSRADLLGRNGGA